MCSHITGHDRKNDRRTDLERNLFSEVSLSSSLFRVNLKTYCGVQRRDGPLEFVHSGTVQRVRPLLASITSKTDTGSNLVAVEVVALFIDWLEPFFPVATVSVEVVAHDIESIGVADLRSAAPVI